MENWREAVELRARNDADLAGRKIDRALGFGYDGMVFSTSCQSAIKALRFEPLYPRARRRTDDLVRQPRQK
jgi:hypothetical protein